MKNGFEKRVRSRTVFLTILFLIWFAGIAFRLIQLQVLRHDQLKETVTRQSQDIVTVLPKRGTIFDKQGRIMATSLPSGSLFYSARSEIPVERQFAEILRLRRILNLTPGTLRRIKERIAKNASFIWIERQLTREQEDRVRRLDIKGLAFAEESRRTYPNKTLVSHVLGRVNVDGEGQSGVEKSYNTLLEGRKGESLNLRDARRRKYRLEILKSPQPGKDIHLTIDETIQYIAARALHRAIHEHRARWGTVLVSHPGSGEILAMVNYPEADLTDSQTPAESIDRNKAVHETFEPGSTFKIITAAAALESGSIDPAVRYDVHLGYRAFGRNAIRDHHRYDSLDFREVIIHSSNVGATLIADQLGQRRLHDMIAAFRVGQRTGIDLPAEERGLFRPVEDWTRYSHNYLAIGYEIGVTSIQMLQVVNTVANRGIAVPLRIVKRTPEVEMLDNGDDRAPRRVISESTAGFLHDILVSTVTSGTGRQADIPGFISAGKTGTARKLDPSSGGYTSKAHRASFVGYVPAERPVLSMMIVIDSPQGRYYGGDVAAPIFQEIGAEVLQHLGVPPQPEIPRARTTAPPARSRRP